jgi:hypothetical protein
LIAAWRSTIERNTPRFNRRRVRVEKKVSTAFSQEPACGGAGARANKSPPGGVPAAGLDDQTIESLEQIDHPAPGLAVALDVTLRRLQAGMAGKLLHIA